MVTPCDHFTVSAHQDIEYKDISVINMDVNQIIGLIAVIAVFLHMQRRPTPVRQHDSILTGYLHYQEIMASGK
jgi:hypothetical protein